MSVTGTAGGRIAPGVGANLIGQHAQDRNQDATIYVGNLDTLVTEELVWELFTQAGPIVNVYLPKDRVTNAHQGYGFVEFRGEEDADYAIKILNMIKVYGKPIRVNKASQDKKIMDVGANLFIGNLDPDVDEKLLYDTFSAFGVIISTPKIMRDPETGNSRGFGFVSYDCYEAADAAIDAMNGQFLCNRSISVSYAFKKDTKGERHGTPAERLLAAQQRAKQAQQSRPHTLFAAGPREEPQYGPYIRPDTGHPSQNPMDMMHVDPASMQYMEDIRQQAQPMFREPMWNSNSAAIRPNGSIMFPPMSMQNRMPPQWPAAYPPHIPPQQYQGHPPPIPWEHMIPTTLPPNMPPPPMIPVMKKPTPT